MNYSLLPVLFLFVLIIWLENKTYGFTTRIKNSVFEIRRTFQLFDHLKQLRGEDIIEKIYPIAGDVSEVNLAINESDRRLLADTVQIVFHAAATIRFDEALRKAVMLNTRGTKMVLELAQEMKNLEVNVENSTELVQTLLHANAMNFDELFYIFFPPPSPHSC